MTRDSSFSFRVSIVNSLLVTFYLYHEYCDSNCLTVYSVPGFTGRCIRTCHEIANGETDYFDEIMNAVMVNIEQMLPRLSRRNGTPNDRGGQQYQQWLKELDRDSVTHKSREQCTLVQHLQVYNTALAIKKCCRVKDALKYVTEFHDRQREDKFKDIDRNLRALYQKVRFYCFTCSYGSFSWQTTCTFVKIAKKATAVSLRTFSWLGVHVTLLSLQLAWKRSFV